MTIYQQRSIIIFVVFGFLVLVATQFESSSSSVSLSKEAMQCQIQDHPLVFFQTIDVNRATSRDLQTIPRIGPVLAERIIAYRETHGFFTHLDDLQKVQGVGGKTVVRLHHYLHVVPR